MLDKNGILKVANVGDCGLRVIRKGNTRFYEALISSKISLISDMFFFV